MEIIEYQEKYLEDVKNKDGKYYIGVENGKAIGVIMGIVGSYEEYDYLDYKCSKRGEIIELIVTRKIRSSGLGQQLMTKMEHYFKSIGCEYVIIDVFAYNDLAINFYNRQGYHTRELIDIKKYNNYHNLYFM